MAVAALSNWWRPARRGAGRSSSRSRLVTALRERERTGAAPAASLAPRLAQRFGLTEGQTAVLDRAGTALARIGSSCRLHSSSTQANTSRTVASLAWVSSATAFTGCWCVTARPCSVCWDNSTW